MKIFSKQSTVMKSGMEFKFKMSYEICLDFYRETHRAEDEGSTFISTIFDYRAETLLSSTQANQFNSI